MEILASTAVTGRTRRIVRLAATLNLAYFGVEFAVALSVGSVSLFADSIDFLEDTAINLVILLALDWNPRYRARRLRFRGLQRLQHYQREIVSKHSCLPKLDDRILNASHVQGCVIRSGLDSNTALAPADYPEIFLGNAATNLGVANRWALRHFTILPRSLMLFSEGQIDI